MYNTIKMELYRMVRMKSFYVIMLIMTAMTVFGTWAINEEVAYNKEEAQKTEQSLNAIQQGVGENQEIEEGEKYDIVYQLTPTKRRKTMELRFLLLCCYWESLQLSPISF